MDSDAVLRVAYRNKDVFERMNSMRNLRDETDVLMTGESIEPEAENFLRVTYRGNTAASKNAMRRVGLYPTDGDTGILMAETIDPDDGLIGGYTDGRVVGINTNVVPGTRQYGRFRERIKRVQGQFGRYLYDKFGSYDLAAESARYTLGHEDLHKKTQLNPMKKYDGKKSPVFRDELVDNLTERYRQNLPKALRWLAKPLAHMSYRPLLEGLNEVTSENVFNGESTLSVRQKRGNGPTTYDRPAAAAADSLYRIGVEEKMDRSYNGMDFYSDWADNPGKFMNRYINGFMEGLSKSYADNGMMMEISPACHYLKAA